MEASGCFRRLHRTLPRKRCVVDVNLFEKQRVIQEYVPGKQLTLVHVIANPQEAVCRYLGLDQVCTAVGIMTITPGEAVVIAADVALKAADVQLGFLDRFGGSLVLTGDVASVDSAMRAVAAMFTEVLRFSVVPMTRS